MRMLRAAQPLPALLLWPSRTLVSGIVGRCRTVRRLLARNRRACGPALQIRGNGSSNGRSAGTFRRRTACHKENDEAMSEALHRVTTRRGRRASQGTIRKIIGDKNSVASPEPIEDAEKGTCCLNGDPSITIDLRFVQIVQLSNDERTGVRTVNVTGRILYGNASVAIEELGSWCALPPAASEFKAAIANLWS